VKIWYSHNYRDTWCLATTITGIQPHGSTSISSTTMCLVSQGYCDDECKEIRMCLNTSTQAIGIALLMVNIYTNYCEQCLVLTTNCWNTSAELYACNADKNFASISFVSQYDSEWLHNISVLLHKLCDSFVNMYLGFRHARILSHSSSSKSRKRLCVSNTGCLYP